MSYKRARDIAAPAHLGALMAAKPRIQAMIQEGVIAEAVPGNSIETAISTYFDALDDEDKVTAKLYVQKAAQAVEESWQ